MLHLSRRQREIILPRALTVASGYPRTGDQESGARRLSLASGRPQHSRPDASSETINTNPYGKGAMTFVFHRARQFFNWEPSAGLLLIFATVLAVLANNSFASSQYSDFLNTPVAVQIGSLSIDKPLLLWINDGLMAIFFFVIGLEIKREVVQGQLSTVSQVILPLFAAVGGMVGPALVYLAINQGIPANTSGWAIPAATDIASSRGRVSNEGVVDASKSVSDCVMGGSEKGKVGGERRGRPHG